MGCKTIHLMKVVQDWTQEASAATGTVLIRLGKCCLLFRRIVILDEYK